MSCVCVKTHVLMCVHMTHRKEGLTCELYECHPPEYTPYPAYNHNECDHLEQGRGQVETKGMGRFGHPCWATTEH